jgi:hypothetical protein
MKKLLTLFCLLMLSCSSIYCQEGLFKKESESLPHKNIIPNADEITNLPHKLKKFLRSPQQTVVVRPGHCEWVYVDGCELLYAYYAYYFSITVLSGYNQGLQGFYNYGGYLIDGSYDWAFVMTDQGLTMMHQYLDSVVYTSFFDQEVVFY